MKRFTVVFTGFITRNILKIKPLFSAAWFLFWKPCYAKHYSYGPKREPEWDTRCNLEKDWTSRPYKKPDNKVQCIHTGSNHSLNIVKYMPVSA